MMVDYKFDALYSIQVRCHREPSEVGLEECYLKVCIDRWSYVCVSWRKSVSGAH